MTIAEKITRAKADIDAVYEGGKAKAFSEVEPINSELEQILYGKDTGGKSYYDEFWDDLQDYGKRTGYGYAFRQWGDGAFKPKYDIRPQSAINGMFGSCNITNLKQILSDCGVVLDTSLATSFVEAFAYSPKLTHVPTIDTRNAEKISYTFCNCYALIAIEKIILREDGSQTFDNKVFQNCNVIESLTIEGVIGSNGFEVTKGKLNKQSITSIINALSTTTSGLTVTLSKTSVNKEFTEAEWNALIAPKSNWTISLV